MLDRTPPTRTAAAVQCIADICGAWRMGAASPSKHTSQCEPHTVTNSGSEAFLCLADRSMAHTTTAGCLSPSMPPVSSPATTAASVSRELECCTSEESLHLCLLYGFVLLPCMRETAVQSDFLRPVVFHAALQGPMTLRRCLVAFAIGSVRCAQL